MPEGAVRVTWYVSMRYFRAVAESKGFREAARQLHIVHPPQSRPTPHASYHRLSRSRRALMATITVDSDMSTAPAAGVSRMPAG